MDGTSTQPIDADNHYYEPLDAFTRHLDKEFRDRGVQPGAGRQAGPAADRRQGQPVRPQPDVRPDHRAGLPRPAVPGPDPRGRRPPLAHAGRAAARRVPGPRPPPRGHGRAGPRRGAAVPDPRLRRRGGAARRHPRHHGQPLGVQPLARGGLGLRPRAAGIIAAPMLSLADPDAAVAEVDSLLERGRPHRARPPRPGARAQRHQPVARRQAATTRCGPAWPRPGSRWPSTSATAATRAGSRRPGGRTTRSASARATPSARCSSPTGPSTTPSPSLVVHGVFKRHPSAARRQHRERVRLAARAGQAPAQAGQPDARGCSPRTRSTRCGATSGSRPYLEEDLAALAELIGVERILFGSDWPHGEGVAQPLDFAKELGGFDEQAVQRIMRDNCRRAARGGRVTSEAERRGAPARRPVGRGPAVARRQLGPRPHRRRLVEGRRRRRVDGAALPARAGRAGPEPAVAGASSAPRSPTTAPCARPAASGC